MRIVVALALAPLLLAGCGGADAGEASAKARESAAAKSSEPPDTNAAFVPEALAQFRCEADDDGAWFATGEVENSTDQAASYQVSVQVGNAGQDVASVTLEVPDLAAGKRSRFTFDELPTSQPKGPCRVQVMAIPAADN